MAEQIVVLDEQKMLEHIQGLPKQFEIAWTSLWTKDFPVKPGSFDRVIIAGMGGSGISGQLIADYCWQNSLIPIETIADYQLPKSVTDKTLIIVSSHSGDTEEELDITRQAAELKLPTICLTTGGKLKELAEIKGLPVILFNDGDRSTPPRTSLGYQYGLLLTLFAKLEIIDLKETAYFQALTELKTVVEKKTFLSKAEDLAITLNNKLPIITSHRPLTGVARRWQCQFHENAKTLAVQAMVPEMNHNLIAGLDFPIPEKLAFLFLESNYGFSRNVARKKILQKVLTDKGISFTPLSVKSGNLLAEQWLLIYFGDLLSYYLAGVYGVDPTPIEAIDSFKELLEKS